MRYNQVVGYLAKEEVTHGTAVTLANADDGVNPYIGDGDPAAPEKIDYVFDGKIGNAAGNLAPQRRTTPNGRFREGQIQVLSKGPGTAYTSSAVKPPREVFLFWKAAGFDATFSTDRWLLTPSAPGDAYTSLTVRQFSQGLQYDMAGVICDASWETSGLGVPLLTFPWRGLPSLPTDLALPSITYDATAVIPPVASAVIANIGSFAFGNGGVLRKVSYKRNRSITTARIAQNLAGGHAGFVPGRAYPTFEVEMESTALVSTPFHTANGIDAERLKAEATSVAVDFTFGTVTGNKWKHSFAQAQCVDVTPGNDGPIGIVTLSFAAHGSTPSSNDYETVTYF